MNTLQQAELFEVEDIEQMHLEPNRFEITDLNSLNWAFRKIAALKTKEKEVKQLADAERDRISDWERSELNPVHNSIEFFESLIQQYHSRMLADDPKAKTLSTPYGKSKTRRTKEQADKADEKVILQHVVENGMDEYIKPTLKWADLKKSLKIVEVDGQKVAVDGTGQIVPGVSVKPESISYSVEV